MPDIWFPFLGIKIYDLSRIAFSIGDFEVAWYGVIIACGFLLAFIMCIILAKKTKQDEDYYWTFFIFAMIFGLVGARLYYVAFEWSTFHKSTLWDTILAICDIRSGGLAIYGGVIAVFITGIVYAKIKKHNFFLMADTCMPCLALGQAIGRWGNFFNQEAFGGYTEGLFAMRLNVKTAYYTTTELLQKAITIDGTTYIQVHPTFLYESFGCLIIVIISLILFYLKEKKPTLFGKANLLTNGHIMCTYFIGYGLLRAILETLRTDSLYINGTDLRISVLVSIAIAVIGIVLFVLLLFKKKKELNQKEEVEAE